MKQRPTRSWSRADSLSNQIKRWQSWCRWLCALIVITGASEAAPPENDDFANSCAVAPIPRVPSSTDGTTTDATLEPAEPPFPGGLDGHASVWFCWEAPASITYHASAAARFSSLLAILDVFTGDTLESLVPVTDLDDLDRRVSFAATAGVRYHFRVAGKDNTEGELTLNLEPIPSPSNDDFPGSRLANPLPLTTAGNNTSGSLEPGEPVHGGASRGQSVWWSWEPETDGFYRVEVHPEAGSALQRWGLSIYTGDTVDALSRIAWATNPKETFAVFPATTGTAYRIAVEDVRNVDSRSRKGHYQGEFELFISSAAAPIAPNDRFPDRIRLAGLPVASTASASGARRDPEESFAPDPVIWWTWTAPRDETVDLRVTADGFQAELALFTGMGPGDLQEVRQVDPVSQGSTRDRLVFEAKQDVEYHVAASVPEDAQGEVAIELTARPEPAVVASVPRVSFTTNGVVYATVVQADGKIIIGGDFSSVNGMPRHNLARLNANGTTDTTWSPRVDGVVRCLALARGELRRSPNDLFIGGDFDWVDGMPRRGLARIVDGQVDPSWRVDVLGGSVHSLVVEDVTDRTFGDLWAGGDFSAGRAGELGIVREGRLLQIADSGDRIQGALFLPGEYPVAEVRALHIFRPNPEFLYAAGRLSKETPDLVRPFAVEIIGGTGIFNSFADPREGVDWSGDAIDTIAADDLAVYLGGDFVAREGGEGGLEHRNLLKADRRDARIFSEWNPPLDSAAVHALELKGNDLYIGYEPPADNPTLGLRRVGKLESGNIDASFQPGEDDGRGAVFSIALEGRSVYVGGALQSSGDDIVAGMIRVHQATGGRDPSFPPFVQKPGRVHALARQPDRKLIVGGAFFFADGLPRRNLARLNEDGTLDQTWSPDPDGPVDAILTVGNRTFIGGGFSMVGNLPRHGLAKLSATGSDRADLLWDPFGDDAGRILTLATNETEDFLLVGGEFSSIGGLPHANLAKLELDDAGVADPDWNPSPNGPVHAIAVADGSTVIGGQFTEVAGSPRSNLAKLDAADPGTLDPSWTPNPDGPIRALAIHHDHLFAGGQYSSIAGVARSHLAKLSLTDSGLADPQWTSDTDDEVLALAFSGNALYAAGHFTSINGISRTKVASFNPDEDGTPLDWDGGHNGLVRTLFGDQTRLYTGGDFTQAGERPRGGLALFATPRPPGAARAAEDGQFLIARDREDGPEITHLQVTYPDGLQLFREDGTRLASGDYVAASEDGVLVSFVGDVSLSVTVGAALFVGDPSASENARDIDLSSVVQQTSFSFAETSFVIDELDTKLDPISIPVGRIGQGSSTVSYEVRPLTASRGGFTSGDYAVESDKIHFAASDDQLPITLLIRGDDLVEGDETFEIVLMDADNGAMIGHPSVARITIVENDVENPGSRLEVFPPNPLVVAPLGSVRLTLDPPHAEWRLRGNSTWHRSGDLVEGLEQGEHTAEFRPLEGYRPPGDFTFPVTGGAVYENQLPLDHRPIQSRGNGTLLVRIFPTGIPARWRFVRPGGDSWRTRNEPVTLPEGIYEIEFEPIDLRVTPPSRTVAIAPGQVNAVEVLYREVVDPFGIQLEPLSLDQAMEAEPFYYLGQVASGGGAGTGFATTKHTVLTAAHLIFDDVTLTWRPDARWKHQRYRDHYEPSPRLARGQLARNDYAAQRQKDRLEDGIPPGVGTRDSRAHDAAVLYFFKPAARGGSGGYLSSEGPDQWLASDADKLLAGYALDPDPDKRQHWWKPHASPLDKLLRFTEDDQEPRIYTTDEVRGSPGASGAPLFVKAPTGDPQHPERYYPAGIYLGGTGETVVRVIDREVVQLINFAEEKGSSGANHVSGGVTYIAGLTGLERFSRGILQIAINQPADAQWRFVGESDAEWKSTSYTTLDAGDFTIEFRNSALPGYRTPSPLTLTVLADQLAVLEVEYPEDQESNAIAAYRAWLEEHCGPGTPWEGSYYDDSDRDGAGQLLEFAFGLHPKRPDAATLSATEDQPGLPSFETIATGDTTKHIRVTYLRRRLEGLDYTVEFSPDHLSWQTAGDETDVIRLDDTWDRVRVEAACEPATCFGRVRVTLSE